MERDNRSNLGRILLGVLTFIALIAAAYYVVIRVAARVADGVEAPRRVKSGEKPRRAARAKKRDENESGIRDFRFDDDDINDCFDADDGDDEDALEVVICGAKESAEKTAEKAEEKIEDAFEGFADAAEDAFDGIKDAAEDIIDDVTDAAEDIAEEIADAAEDVAEDVADGVADALSEDSLDQLLDD